METKKIIEKKAEVKTYVFVGKEYKMVICPFCGYECDGEFYNGSRYPTIADHCCLHLRCLTEDRKYAVFCDEVLETKKELKGKMKFKEKIITSIGDFFTGRELEFNLEEGEKIEPKECAAKGLYSQGIGGFDYARNRYTFNIIRVGDYLLNLNTERAYELTPREWDRILRGADPWSPYCILNHKHPKE